MDATTWKRAGLELARVVWGWVTCSNKETNKETNKRTNVHCPATCTEAPVVGAWFCDSDETQRAHYTARRKEVWEALHPEPSPDYSLESYVAEDETEVGKVCPPQFAGQLGGARPQTKGFAAATAEVTGESKRAINLNLARAEAIGPDILKLSGTSLDKGVELDALAKLPGQYRDGDEKVLLRGAEARGNAGASIGSFSPP